MGVYLSEPNKTKNTITGSLGKLSYCSTEMQGWRKSMEDAAIHQLDIGDGNSLFAVFDGHGGAEVSECVRQIFIPKLKSTAEYGKKDYAAALDIAFKNIDEFLFSQEGVKKLQQIRSKGSNNTSEMNQGRISNGTGCTANVVLITPDKIYVANAGDSRSALSRSHKCIQLSEDHKPENSIEIQRIKKAGGTIAMGRVNGGLNLTRSFGDFDYKLNQSLEYHQQMITCKPDVKEYSRDLAADEFIIIGCDGIWEQYVDNSQQLVDIINKQLDLGKNSSTIIMENLLDYLLAKDTSEGLGCDNMTAILVTFK